MKKNYKDIVCIYKHAYVKNKKNYRNGKAMYGYVLDDKTAYLPLTEEVVKLNTNLDGFIYKYEPLEIVVASNHCLVSTSVLAKVASKLPTQKYKPKVVYEVQISDRYTLPHYTSEGEVEYRKINGTKVACTKYTDNIRKTNKINLRFLLDGNRLLVTKAVKGDGNLRIIYES